MMDDVGVYSVDSPENKMSKVEILRGLITERMTIAVREILAVVETTVAGYEDEVLLLKRELGNYERKLHAILQPQVHLDKIDMDGVGTPDMTSSHSADAFELRHMQVDTEDDDCSVPEKCIRENGVDRMITTVSHEDTLLKYEQSDCTLTELPRNSSVSYREEAFKDDSVKDVQHTKVKRRRQLPWRYRSNHNLTGGDSDSYDIGKNSDNEWKPNKNKKPRSSNVKKNRLIKLRIGLLKNSPGSDLSNNVFSLEGPVQTTLCQQNLRESDFTNQLRSIFPELGENKNVGAYLTNGTKKTVPHLANKMTLNELYQAFKSQEQKEFDFYLQREHGDTSDTLTNTTLLLDERPTSYGLEGEIQLETEGTSNLIDEMDNMAGTMESAAQIGDNEDGDDDDDDNWTAAQKNEDKEHSAASKSEINIRRDTGQQRLHCYSCQVCGYLFKSSLVLIKHALSHLDNPKCMCGVCGQQLESSEDLKAHLESHQKLRQCETCGQYFVRLKSLQKHVDTHRIDQTEFNCLICHKVFASNKLLNKHELLHKNNKPYKCDICPRSFNYKTALEVHYRKHTGEKPYCCDVCGKSLTTYRSLSQHKLIHFGEKNYSCHQCGKLFYSVGFLKRHEKTHTVREKKHLCDLCSKTFLTKRELDIHLNVHSNLHIVKCPFCDKLLKGNLDIHMRVHTGEKPFSCKECGKKFAHQSHLKTHMLVIHLGVKSLSCTVCGYKCARKHYLDSHMRTHTGHKPYKCTLCDQAFTQSHCLKTHMKSHQREDLSLGVKV